MKKAITAAMLLGIVFTLPLTVAARELSGQEKAMAIEAARADLYAQLARQIKGLQIDDSSIVANHVTEERVNNAFVEALVQGARVGEPTFVDDVCIIHGSIDLDQVVENLHRVTREISMAPDTSFERIRRYNEITTIRAQGTGTVKAPSQKRGFAAADEQERGLVETISALSGTGQEKLGAVEAARIDAYAQLARHIKGLRISDESTVFNMALESRWTEMDTQAVVKGATVEQFSAVGSDLVACTMSISLQQVVENVRKVSRTYSDGRVVSHENVRRFNPDLVTVTATGYGAIGRGAMNSGRGSSSSGNIIGTVR